MCQPHYSYNLRSLLLPNKSSLVTPYTKHIVTFQDKECDGRQDGIPRRSVCQTQHHTAVDITSARLSPLPAFQALTRHQVWIHPRLYIQDSLANPISDDSNVRLIWIALCMEVTVVYCTYSLFVYCILLCVLKACVCKINSIRGGFVCNWLFFAWREMAIWICFLT